VAAQLTAKIGQAISKKTSWDDALDDVQGTVSDYASKQGFKVGQ
jgi:hypothetical protein